jgi:hypothetical protein
MTPNVVYQVQTRPRRSLPGDETPVDRSADFAQWVKSQLDGPVLRYSARLGLLKEGQRRGLGRFEANLVIAAVLYREGMGQEYEMRPKAEWVAPLVTFLLLQSALLAGAWWVLG